jgi:hypothetical protein
MHLGCASIWNVTRRLPVGFLAAVVLARFTNDREHEFEAREIYGDDGELGLVLREVGGEQVTSEDAAKHGTQLEIRCDFCGRWSTTPRPTSHEPHPRWKCDEATGCL